MKYYFILIAILEADLRYNNDNNIVYKDADDGVLTEDGFTYIYIYKEIMAEDLAVLSGLCNRQIMTMMGNWLIRFT